MQRGRGVGETEQRFGEIEQHEADHRERGGEPERLPHFLADLLLARRAEKLPGDRLQRDQDAGQPDIDRDIYRRPEPERGKIGGGKAADHRGIDHAERDDRQLADQHRPRERRDPADIGEHCVQRLRHRFKAGAASSDAAA